MDEQLYHLSLTVQKDIVRHGVKYTIQHNAERLHTDLYSYLHVSMYMQDLFQFVLCSNLIDICSLVHLYTQDDTLHLVCEEFFLKKNNN